MSDDRQRINQLFAIWDGSNLETRDGLLNLITGGRPFCIGDRARAEAMREIWRELPRQEQDLFFKAVIP